MKKSVSLIFFCILWLTACNFPLSKPTVDKNFVATRVAQVLTETSLPQSGVTLLPATQTNAFTETPISTLTETPTITTTPSDPSKMYGDPVWHNTLDSGAGFGLTTAYNDGNTEFYISGGKMIMKSLSLSGWKGWRLTDRKIPNFYMEDIFNIHDCSGTDSYGLVFRAPDYESGFGYYYGIACDGKYSLLRWSADGQAYLQNWKSAAEINAGANVTNKVGVLAKGTNIQLFINGKLIQEFNDPAFPAETIIGVFIAGLNTPEFTVELDQVDLWQIP